MSEEIIIALIVGAIAGIVSGTLGVGGGTVTIPIMVIILGLEQHTAQGVALCAMLFASLVGTTVHYRQRNVELNMAFWIAPSAAIASLLGAWIAGMVSSEWLTKIFAICLLIIGCRMLLFSRGGQDVSTNSALPRN